jgi:hypothetical protein
MRRVIIILFLVLFPLICFAEKIRLEWDPPTDQNITGVKVFQKTAKDGDNYDFSAPVAIVDKGVDFADVELPGEPNTVLKYQFVARAYRDIYESANSNEVSYKVINIMPISPSQLSGKYENGVVTLTWLQPEDPYPIYKWIVYYRLSPNDSWIELGTVDDLQNLTITKAFDAVPDGQRKTVTFSVTAFRRSGVYSTDNTVASVIIDRLGSDVPPIQNLRINIEIPVQ